MKHQYSRAELYALGEPLGNDATRRKPGCGVVYGKGGSSSSSQASSTTTTTTDKRLVVDGGSLGVSVDGSANVNVESLDANIVNKALETVAAADATAGEGFDKLLQLTENLFDAGGKLLENNATTTLAQLEQLNTARNDTQGKIDQKTIVVLVAGAVAVAWALRN